VRPHFILFFGKEAANGPKTEKMWAMNIHTQKKKKKKKKEKRKKQLIIITIKLCFNNNFLKKKVKVKIKVQEFVACIFFLGPCYCGGESREMQVWLYVSCPLKIPLFFTYQYKILLL
jgi:hypothetical protein